jgi:FkbM family methyltransferase
MISNILLRTTYRVRFLALHPAKSFSYIFSKRKDYSKIDISEIDRYLNDPKVIVEAGAADGVDTFVFSRSYPKAKVYGIEPVIEQYEYLKRKFVNVENIDISHFALAEKNGTGTINIGKNAESLSGMGSSSLMEPTKHMKYFPEISFARKQEVQLITLVDFAKSFGISFVDLLWLDLQGKELDVLNGSSEFLRENVLLLHLELSRVQFYDGMPTIRDVRKFLRKSGFVILIDRVGAISGNSLYINARFKNR